MTGSDGVNKNTESQHGPLSSGRWIPIALFFGGATLLFNLIIYPVLQAGLDPRAVEWRVVFGSAGEEVIKSAIKGVFFGWFMVAWVDRKRRKESAAE
jgi:hypothetical protein